ncbi:MAG: hypothetical protein J2P58_10070 [Acidimicrobiaceae bacterium]|nr:hypothetical protein [Acidimicrobiaceae bacterium]
MPPTKHISKAEANRVLKRVGFGEEQVRKLFAELDDPIDLERDSRILVKHGVTRDYLNDLMGGSP